MPLGSGGVMDIKVKGVWVKGVTVGGGLSSRLGGASSCQTCSFLAAES